MGYITIGICMCRLVNYVHYRLGVIYAMGESVKTKLSFGEYLEVFGRKGVEFWRTVLGLINWIYLGLVLGIENYVLC